MAFYYLSYELIYDDEFNNTNEESIIEAKSIKEAKSFCENQLRELDTLIKEVAFEDCYKTDANAMI